MGSIETELTSGEVHRRLLGVMRRDVSVAEKASEALELGQRYLDVTNGHLTRIDPAANYWEAIGSSDPDGEFPVGLSLNLETTYCRRVLTEESQIALHAASEQGWADDPAYEKHGYQCYVGTPIEVNDRVYGTLCFLAEEARSTPFGEDEVAVAELIARLLGNAIEREQFRTELAEKTEMVTVLDRVLRHNLRNDMNVVRGHAETLEAVQNADIEHHTGVIVRTVDDLLNLTEHARRLNRLVSESFERRPTNLEAMLEGVVRRTRLDYPTASISLTGGEGARLLGTSHLETAFAELAENAAKHAGPDPTVELTVEEANGALRVRVADDGPGLAEQDAAVLDQGSESPLKHGSGLGLWLINWVVTRHDGDIDIESSGDGTTVTVTLPYGPRNYLVDDRTAAR